MQWGNSFGPRRYLRPLGVRPAPSAAEQHDALPEFGRFDQKYNMIFQPVWNERYSSITDGARSEKCARLVRRGVKGYRPLDWGLMLSSDANMKATGSGINSPNQGATRWALGPGLPKDVERWEGSPQEAAEIVKAVCGFYGADLTGICEYDRRHVYSHYFDLADRKHYPIVFSDEAGLEEIEAPVQLEDKTQVIPAAMKYAVVMVFEMNRMGIATAPSLASQATTRAIYSKMSFTVASVAEFLRGLGYHAIPSLNDTAANIPLAVDAGLGEVGRNAKLINPLFGPRCRIAKVFTDLPLAVDHPIQFGVTRFCEQCAICAEACPSKSIPFGPRSYEAQGDYSRSTLRQWQLAHDKCREYWAKTGTNCGICLHACPYNGDPGVLHWLFTSAAAAMPFLDRALVAAAKRSGVGKRVDSEKLWESLGKRREE